ncbi:hypothetical protein SPRG_06879 [Saprolegnia parasitica CBS 223.65]|uniref:Uncharacterized protein n=1 Tax=Saprolegnia parasitica (strain CBS 223.65) TaxID=695850 RepID=A0A067CM47_SAPPC|nr:hypothetical protein SPRG_06879 [Saprolegnia parasitica CBS 223.65]KDO27611.1 hypothetical protein SPRG_06879 [Saprolegnia parasitica CBS 223.65]|eukprot:XP_012201733.1 hypothetical protein SPRG_06879 [Saprolegnia parasitica CBS 223.65]
MILFATLLGGHLGRIGAPLAAPLARCAKNFVITLMRKKRDKLACKYTAKFGFVATIAAFASVCLITLHLAPETRLLSTDPRHKHWNMFIKCILNEPTEKRQRRRDELRPSVQGDGDLSRAWVELAPARDDEKHLGRRICSGR